MFYLSVLYISILVINVNPENIEEQCHTFAGGAVYPNTEGRASGHNLQWTKAMISKPAPDWDATAVIDGQFKQLKLSDFLGKYVVFFFYPLDFTFVCPTEILAFNDRVKEFHALNAEVIACSIDSHFTHLAWTKSPRNEGGLGKLSIPLVSDITHSIAKDYGVYLEDQGVALRGLFIIDEKGVLRQITMNDLPVGRSVDETLRLVQAFQFTDKHGEVCPAGWKPGDATIIPTPEDSRKYFKKANQDLTSFEMQEVVPDVIDAPPAAVVQVEYPAQLTVNLGNELNKQQTQVMPSIKWAAEEGSLYTVIMTDPDAPSRKNPVAGEWLHLLVVNIPGSSVKEGEILVQYNGPAPPVGTGLHRYVFLVYKQPKALTATAPEQRRNFSARKFASKYGLELIAGNFFQTQNGH